MLCRWCGAGIVSTAENWTDRIDTRTVLLTVAYGAWWDVVTVFCRISFVIMGNGRTNLLNKRRRYLKKNVVKVVSLVVFLVAFAIIAVSLAGCSEAEKVNYNISKQADYFGSERRITVYNARTDNVILNVEGYMSISNNGNGELVVTCKVGPNEYKKNYVYLNSYTLYVVEDITGTHTDPYHYKLYFHTEILPTIEVKP